MTAIFATFFTDVIDHAPATDFDAYGTPTHSTPTSYPARVTYRRRQVRDRNGETTIARGEAWLAATPSIGFDDKITLPDGSTPPILAVETYSDERGPHHTKIFFG